MCRVSVKGFDVQGFSAHCFLPKPLVFGGASLRSHCGGPSFQVELELRI